MSAPVVDFAHGTSGYANYGCTCEVCRTAYSAWQKRWRATRYICPDCGGARHPSAQRCMACWRAECQRRKAAA